MDIKYILKISGTPQVIEYQKFDVAVIDLFYSECSISLAHHLKQVIISSNFN